MRIASISTEVTCHNWPEGSLTTHYKPQVCEEIKTLSWGKDGGWMVIVPKSGNAEIISLNDQAKLLHVIQIIENPTCAAFQNMTKRNVAIGSNIGQILIYDVKTRSIKKKFPKVSSPFFKVQYSFKDAYVVGGCENGEVFVYNNVSNIISSSFQVKNSSTLSNFKCHPTKKNLIGACSDEGIVSVWDVNRSNNVNYSKIHLGPVTDVTFGTQREMLVSVGMDRKCVLYDYLNNKILSEIALSKMPSAIDFSPEGVGFALGTDDGYIAYYDIRNLKEYIKMFDGHNSSVKQLLFEKAPLGKTLENNSQDEKIEFSTPEIVNNTSCSIKEELDSVCTAYGDGLPDIPEVENEVTTLDSTTTKDSFMEAMISNTSLQTSNLVQEVLISNTSCVSFKKNFNTTSPSAVEIKEELLKSPNTPGNNNNGPVTLQVIENLKGLYPPSSSPIYPVKQCNNPFDEEKIKKIIRETIKEEMEVFKNLLAYQVYDVKATMRRHFLDIHMSLVKEFITNEDHLNRFREELLSYDTVGPDRVFQENFRLKQELKNLKEQLNNRSNK